MEEALSGESFFTYADGKKYLSLAFALARSYRLHNDISLTFGIASKNDFTLPWDLLWVKKIIVPQQAAGSGLEFKLHLLTIAPTPYAIFIDADSLIYANIAHLFRRFQNDKPGVVGLKVQDGEWVDEDIQAICKEFDLKYMIRYCGALYYLVKNEVAAAIFDYAVYLNQSNRTFQRNAHTIYDEPILSVALSKYEVEPLADDGNEWGDLVHFNYNAEVNIFKGPPAFNNNTYRHNYKFWLPAGEYRPKILHVGSGNHNRNPWLFDSLRLKLHYKFFLPIFLSDLIVKHIVIPLYHLARWVTR